MVRNAPKTTPHVKYADGENNGYLYVHLDHERARAEWRYTGPRKERQSGATVG